MTGIRCKHLFTMSCAGVHRARRARGDVGVWYWTHTASGPLIYRVCPRARTAGYRVAGAIGRLDAEFERLFCRQARDPRLDLDRAETCRDRASALGTADARN